MPNIGYLGPPGTHTHRAALAIYPGENLIPYASTHLLTSALDMGKVEHAVLPLENSLEGTVSATFDYLVSTNKRISAEIVLSIDHVLASLKGKKLADIKVIASHPQALAQCSNFINTLGCFTLPTVSTVAAIKELSHEKPTAVILSELAAKIYNLDILSKDIADTANNSTRFCVLSDTFASQTKKDKTSIVFEISDRPGSLYEILQLFAEANINLTKIESRPAKYRLGKYLFAIDFDGHFSEDSIALLLENIKAKCIFLKILGSYPVHSY